MKMTEMHVDDKYDNVTMMILPLIVKNNGDDDNENKNYK